MTRSSIAGRRVADGDYEGPDRRQRLRIEG